MFGLSADESHSDYLAIRSVRIRRNERRGLARHSGFRVRTAEAEPRAAGAGSCAVKFMAWRTRFVQKSGRFSFSAIGLWLYSNRIR
jgi:hypothetical protein